jgi:hypothetical protein
MAFFRILFCASSFLLALNHFALNLGSCVAYLSLRSGSPKALNFSVPIMSAFSPLESDGNHQAPQPSNNTINEIYQFPYFPGAMINPYFNPASGYAFPGMAPSQNQMNNMANLHPATTIQQFSSDPFTNRLFPNNSNLALYNNSLKNELFEV